MYIFAQSMGIIAMIIAIFSFQQNDHKKIMIMQFFASLLFGLQFYFLGEMTGAFLNIVSLTRNTVFYYKDKKWAKSIWWIVLFCIMYVVSGILTFNTLWSLLPTVAMILNTITFSSRDPKFVRKTILISSPMWLVYNVHAVSIGGILCESFVIISSVIGIIRFDIGGSKISKNAILKENLKW